MLCLELVLYLVLSLNCTFKDFLYSVTLYSNFSTDSICSLAAISIDHLGLSCMDFPQCFSCWLLLLLPFGKCVLFFLLHSFPPYLVLLQSLYHSLLSQLSVLHFFYFVHTQLLILHLTFSPVLTFLFIFSQRFFHIIIPPLRLFSTTTIGSSTFARKTLTRIDIFPKYTCPNGHLPEWTLTRMDTYPKWTLARVIHLPEWTLTRIDICPNVHLPKWTFAQMDTCPNGHLPESTFARM